MDSVEVVKTSARWPKWTLWSPSGVAASTLHTLGCLGAVPAASQIVEAYSSAEGIEAEGALLTCCL